MQNPEAFRIYFQGLSPDSQRELYQCLKGPAGDALVESLGIRLPLGASGSATQVDPVQIQKHLTGLVETIHSQNWKAQHYFGFLTQLTDDQLIILAKHEDPTSIALMLQSLKPHRAAKLLRGLSSEERVKIFSQSARIESLSSVEMSAFERILRTKALQLPKVLSDDGFQGKDLGPWKKILALNSYDDELLSDFEKARPDQSQQLEKLRFRIEDIRHIPQESIRRITLELENEELASALVSCPLEVSSILLGSLSPGRRAIVEGLAKASRQMTPEALRMAKQTLIERFKEAVV
jgi:flagellar motor switch protein FliG